MEVNESQFINFNPIKALTILAELLAEQEGKRPLTSRFTRRERKCHEEGNGITVRHFL